MEYATAVLLSGEKQVGGAVANSDGDFSMEAEAGKYRLVVQCLGYEPLRKELILPIKQMCIRDRYTGLLEALAGE